MGAAEEKEDGLEGAADNDMVETKERRERGPMNYKRCFRASLSPIGDGRRIRVGRQVESKAKCNGERIKRAPLTCAGHRQWLLNGY